MRVRLVNNPPKPTFTEERLLESQGYHLVAGIDEAGRGALAGPVVAAAVILPRRLKTPWLNQIKDSKQLSPARRELLFHNIHEAATSIGIGMVQHEAIDTQGIIKAVRLAMKLAVDQLSPPAESLLIDYMHLPEVSLPQKAITNGDCLCFSIACASIIAKVARDQLMVELDHIYPDYGLAQHKGYGTAQHIACLRRLGPCPIHRQSFQPVKDIMK
jgi:ribonuclease HII